LRHFCYTFQGALLFLPAKNAPKPRLANITVLIKKYVFFQIALASGSKQQCMEKTKTTTSTHTLIIGAGPAGLATAGRLRQLDIPFEILEKSQNIADSWHQHYDRLCLHTVKELSSLPGLPFPEDYPRYVPRALLVAYFEKYAETFQIHPQLGQEVVHLRRKQGKWLVRTTQQDFRATNVVIATGVNRVPFLPQWTGQQDFEGKILHSSTYKNPKPFAHQKVLVVGMGNSGAEIALDLSEQGAEAWLSVRGAVNIVPRDFLGNPTQKSALMLAKLPHWLGDLIGVLLRRITIGDLSRYGIATPAIPPSKQLRVHGKTPVMDIGTIAQIKAGKIKVLPDIERFTQKEIVFANGAQLPFDAVILATGYRPQIQGFLEYTKGLLDANDLPKYIVGEGEYQGLYFIGFDNYTAGGTIGVINRDSKTIANAIATAGVSVQDDDLELPE